MTTICKYCNEPENKQDRPGLICENCICFVHLSCLRSEGTPGDFACDVFFDFTCEECSVNKKEAFTRNRFSWVNVILLTLHHLNARAYGISNHGFFHYKMHICSFIDRSWLTLFGSDFKQKKNWVGTIAGALSVYSNLFFKSGSTVLGEQGWWRLQHAFSPAVAAHIIQEMARYKPKGRPRNQMALDYRQTLFFAKVTEMGYKELLQSGADTASEPEMELVPPAKKPRMDSDDMSGISSTSYYDQLDSNSRTELPEDISLDEHHLGLPSREESYSDAETMFRGFDFQPASYMPPSDSSSLYSFQNSIMYYDSDSRSGSPSNNIPETQFEEYDEKPQIDIKKSAPAETKTKKPVAEEKLVFKTESLFSTQPNSMELPWMKKASEIVQRPKKDLVQMTPYEEIQLLKEIENLIPKVKEPNSKAYLCRFRAKLALRRLRRQKHLPMFDLDKYVKLLGGYVTEDSIVAPKLEGVLDRFHRNYQLDSLCGTVSAGEHGVTLIPRMGSAHSRSPYSGALLKPYIRVDKNVDSLWPRLMEELLVKTHRHQVGYKPPARGALVYSYVRPEHIPAVNSLCAQFFWPGIDMTEALQYPEYSCVVTYKRLVVACAFLVPDVSATQAYISFVLTRPEWRNAHIATFMLYHLLQTCTGKDVTLHVSPTNPAVFLYQKFGFKVEELIQDFYEKYYDVDYKGCRHALFLRLTR